MAASSTCCCPTCSASTVARPTTRSWRRSATRSRRGATPTVTDDREVPLLHAQAPRPAADRRASDDGDGRARAAAGDRDARSPTCWRSSTDFHELYARRRDPGADRPVRRRPVQHLPLVRSSRTRSRSRPRCTPTIAASCSRPCARTAAPARRSSPRPGPGSPAATTTTCARSSGSSWCAGRPRSRCGGCSRRRGHASGSAATQPGFVDMPTCGSTTSPTSGDDELVTMFWSDQLFDPDDPTSTRSRRRPGGVGMKGDDDRRHPAGDHPARRACIARLDAHRRPRARAHRPELRPPARTRSSSRSSGSARPTTTSASTRRRSAGCSARR